MNDNQDFDEKIAHALHQASSAWTPHQGLYDNIQQQIDKKHYKERLGMKKSMKYGLACAVLLVTTTTAAYAIGNIESWVSSSNAKDSFEGYPAITEVQEAVGYAPKFVQQFSNGVTYAQASVGQSAAQDAEGNAVVEFKDIAFYYTVDGKSLREGGISLHTAPVVEGYNYSDEKATKYQHGDLTLEYGQQNYKFVPPDYELTAEDQAQMDAGILEISYGSDEITYSHMQFVNWTEGDIHYNLLNNDCDQYGEDEMIAMAKEIIDVEK